MTCLRAAEWNQDANHWPSGGAGPSPASTTKASQLTLGFSSRLRQRPEHPAEAAVPLPSEPEESLQLVPSAGTATGPGGRCRPSPLPTRFQHSSATRLPLSGLTAALQAGRAARGLSGSPGCPHPTPGTSARGDSRSLGLDVF